MIFSVFLNVDIDSTDTFRVKKLSEVLVTYFLCRPLIFAFITQTNPIIDCTSFEALLHFLSCLLRQMEKIQTRVKLLHQIA